MVGVGGLSNPWPFKNKGNLPPTSSESAKTTNPEKKQQVKRARPIPTIIITLPRPFIFSSFFSFSSDSFLFDVLLVPSYWQKLAPSLGLTKRGSRPQVKLGLGSLPSN